MASKALKVKADWSSLAKKMADTDLTKLNKLKSQIDSTVVKASSLPEKLPTIDWAHYKANASDPKLVAELEKQYAKLKVELPKAPSSRLNDLQQAQAQDEARYKKFAEIAESYIHSAEVVKTKFEKMIPIPLMNLEDWTLTFPLWSLHRDNPSLPPHFGRMAGLSKEQAMAFEQPDPVPFATKTAWKDWEERKKQYYS